MKQKRTIYSVAIAAILAGNISYATNGCSNGVGEECDTSIHTTSVNNTINSTTNTVTTTFGQASADSALRLQSVYQAVANVGQKNSGDIYAEGLHDNVVTKGDLGVGVTAIGNNVSAELVGLKNVNLSIAQHNSGEITAYNSVTHPYVGGNLSVNTNAIGNNASVGWDLTTDKNPSNDSFAVKKDGPTLSFSNAGTYLGSIQQCNTGAVTAMLEYNQDPASNIQINTSAIGNNLSFGVKTR